MIKNKDGSYNKFRLLIISLIFIITISITGFYIVENIELPKIEIPSLTNPTPTQTPTPSPTLMPIDPSIALLYNSSNITYNSNTTWNWSYTNFTNTSNWTYPPEIIDNYTFIVGAGGGTGSSANISYAIVAGGGGAGYTSVAYINSTPVVPVIQITPQETSNLSQNVSQVIVQAFNPLGSSSSMMYLIFIIPLVMMTSMMRRNSLSMILPMIIGTSIICYFCNINIWSALPMILMIPMLLIILSIFSDR